MSIARLNAFNGLFLRAEHLERMQEYTRSLAYALGQSGDPVWSTGTARSCRRTA